MNDEEEIIASIALTQTPLLGSRTGKKLLDKMGSAKSILSSEEVFTKIEPKINRKLLKHLFSNEPTEKALKELKFIQKHNITCIPYTDKRYPYRLKECEDAPLILFFKGRCNFNASHIISLVGTRKSTQYGKKLCYDFMEELSNIIPDILIISGLAFGIDIASHKAALEFNFPTVGVLAHGLDRIYPHQHRNTAIEMLSHGGLLTEFPSNTQPERYNFVSRNRIIAGLSDATIVVESASKGGALITADIANSYNRDCFAFPGRTSDSYSKGCNQLIKQNKAALITSAEDFIKAMQWDTQNNIETPTIIQRNLFPNLTNVEQKIVDLLQQQGKIQFDKLLLMSHIPIQQLHTDLFTLEMKGIIRVLAGNQYELV